MKMKKKTSDELNKQMNLEFESAYIYLSMAAWAEEQALPGMAAWLKKQSQEEVEHGMKIFTYLNDRDGAVALAAIPQPKKKWSTALQVFEDALMHEQKVTKSILDVQSKVSQDGDKAAELFLNWYVDEQVEEEAQTRDIIDKLKRVSNAPAGLYMVDKELGQRGDE